MTEPKKQDGTMELDVGQIDLLDLPLPPRSKPAIDSAAAGAAMVEAAAPLEERVSKGPPPLPPAPPAADEEPPVPSLALPQSHPSPSQPHPPVHSSGAISARKLVDGPAKQKSPALQLAIGMGGATLVCVLAFVAWKATHKTPPAPPSPAASASTAPAPTHTFTMAPIEFTGPVSSGSAAPEETATTAPSAHATSAPPTTTTTTTTTTTAKPSGSARGTAPAGTTKPPRTDELIKVEN